MKRMAVPFREAIGNKLTYLKTHFKRDGKPHVPKLMLNEITLLVNDAVPAPQLLQEVADACHLEAMNRRVADDRLALLYQMDSIMYNVGAQAVVPFGRAARDVFVHTYPHVSPTIKLAMDQLLALWCSPQRNQTRNMARDEAVHLHQDLQRLGLATPPPPPPVATVVDASVSVSVESHSPRQLQDHDRKRKRVSFDLPPETAATDVTTSPSADVPPPVFGTDDLKERIDQLIASLSPLAQQQAASTSTSTLFESPQDTPAPAPTPAAHFQTVAMPPERGYRGDDNHPPQGGFAPHGSFAPHDSFAPYGSFAPHDSFAPAPAFLAYAHDRQQQQQQQQSPNLDMVPDGWPHQAREAGAWGHETDRTGDAVPSYEEWYIRQNGHAPTRHKRRAPGPVANPTPRRKRRGSSGRWTSTSRSPPLPLRARDTRDTRASEAQSQPRDEPLQTVHSDRPPSYDRWGSLPSTDVSPPPTLSVESLRRTQNTKHVNVLYLPRVSCHACGQSFTSHEAMAPHLIEHHAAKQRRVSGVERSWTPMYA
jgi:hypothetical protein